MAETDVTEVSGRNWWWTKRMSAWNWRRTSMAVLASIENKIFSCMAIKPEGRYIASPDGSKRLWTVSLNNNTKNNDSTPLVMLHGMGSGVALWVLNLEPLAKDRTVYAIDVLGFGRSSRVKFGSDADQVEAEFVQSIEDWRQAVGVEKMILLGHSMGGFLAASYALQHAERVKHLILVDPWGFQERPPDFDQRPVPMWIRVARTLLTPLNPFSALRMAGPWGPSLVYKFRADLVQKYSSLFDDTRIADYLYHCNAQTPSGEIAFKTLTQPFGWAKRPMLNRICDIPSFVSMTFIHGSRSWVDNGIGREAKYRRTDSHVDFRIVHGAGHHVYADAPNEFNRYVLEACSFADAVEWTKSARDSNSNSHIISSLQPHRNERTNQTVNRNVEDNQDDVAAAAPQSASV